MPDDTQRFTSPTVADVERITALSDPVIRNLQITHCYHQLSAAMAARTGLTRTGLTRTGLARTGLARTGLARIGLARIGLAANWCTFATWASKQAGQTIRKEDLKRTLENALGDSPLIASAAEKVAAAARLIGSVADPDRIRRLIWETVGPGAVVKRTSDAVARGNKKVFEEIGREFARFIAACLRDEKFDAGRIEQFCAGLRTGDPPEGQRYLRQAFAHYYRAFFEEDLRLRAELQLLANLEIGFHEQTRLQPEIAESLDAALINGEELKSRLIAEIFPFGGWLVRARLLFKRLWGGPTPFEIAVNALIAEIRRHLHLAITEHLMTLTLANNERLRLGADLQREFSASLKTLSFPELLSLLAQIDPTPDSLRETGAVDWADLSERLHFIADLFRCCHETVGLHDPPFTTEQINDLQNGRLPGGRL